MTIGILYGISVGPGDPDLITVKGVILLQSTQVIAFPSGKDDKPGVAQIIIQPWLSQHQTLLPLNFPYVQDELTLDKAWHKAAESVWNYLSVGQDVAFACEGDVNFYGTFIYLSQKLLDLHPESLVKAVPGVISPLSAAASLGIPLAQRQQRLAILPALYILDQLEEYLRHADTLVLLKVSSVYSQVWQILKSYNLLKNSYIVERASQAEEKVYRDLENSRNLKLSYFSLLIVRINPV